MPRTSPEAYELINYLYRPEVAAKNSNFLSYANGNLASQKLIDPKIFNDKNIYPDEAMHEEAVRDFSARSGDAAHHQPAVDAGEDREVGLSVMARSVRRSIPSRAAADHCALAMTRVRRYRQRRCSQSH